MISSMKKAAALLLAAAASAAALTLDEALLSVEDAPSTRAAKAQLEADRRKTTAANANFLPRVDFKGSWTYLDRTLEMDLNSLRDALIQLQANDALERAKIQAAMAGGTLTPEQQQAIAQGAAAQFDAALPPFVETLREQSRFDAELTVVQPIFVGGKVLAARGAAKGQEKRSTIALEQARSERISTVAKTYIDATLLRQAVELRRDGVAGIERHVEQAEKLLAEGMIERTQLLRAQLALSTARADLEAEEGRYATALEALRIWTGRDDGPTDELRDVPLPWDSAGAQEAVFRQNLKTREIGAIRAQLDEKSAAERGQMLPTVAAFGSWQILPRELSALEPRWAAGVQVSMPIFAGGKDWSNWKSAKSEGERVEQLGAAWNEGLRVMVLRSWNDRAAAKNRWESLATSERLAEETLSNFEKRFAAGMATSLDVVDARLQYDQARLGRLKSLGDMAKASIEILVLANETSRLPERWNKGKSE